MILSNPKTKHDITLPANIGLALYQGMLVFPPIMPSNMSLALWNEKEEKKTSRINTTFLRCALFVYKQTWNPGFLASDSRPLGLH